MNHTLSTHMFCPVNKIIRRLFANGPHCFEDMSLISTSEKITENTTTVETTGNVFYNPVQEFNRDLSISVLNVFSKIYTKEKQAKKKSPEETYAHVAGHKYLDGLRILEALSATGLRSIRYAKEIAGIKEIIANDLSREAVDSIEKNAIKNCVGHLVEPSEADATTLMYLSKTPEKRFDVIDLDPYGSPTRFLDAAVQSIADGGLLLVTATDMAVLAGNTPESCFAKYGSVPLRTKACHEMALRILLNTIDTHANRYGKCIKPLLSISADFYIRVFVRVFNSQSDCKSSMSKRAMIYQCVGCDIFTLQPLGILKRSPSRANPERLKFAIPTGPAVGIHCEHCKHRHNTGGPIWSHQIHDQAFVTELLDQVQQEHVNLGTKKRLIGMLSVVKEELPDVPLYYTLDKLCSVLKLEIIPILKFRTALLNARHRVSFSHAYKNSIKTDAPPEVIWDILRAWNKIHPVKADRIKECPVIREILSKPSHVNYNFDEIHPDANPLSRKTCLNRYQPNPTPHWGPGTKATIMISDEVGNKSQRNQNKNKKRKLELRASISTLTDTDITPKT